MIDAVVTGISAIIMAFLMIAMIAVIVSLPTMWLWDWLMPIIFPQGGIVHSITWNQALGINILCGLLFKGTTNTKK